MDGITTDAKAQSEILRRAKRQRGVTMIETMFASLVLVVGSLSMVGLIVKSIATNNRNKLDSTQMMLATSIAEQINSTVIGSGESSLTDCNGATHTIDTITGLGANLVSGNVDFSENIGANAAKDNYHMDYVMRTPCTSTGTLQGTYDVRWRVDFVDSLSTTQTYVLTVGARLKNHGEGNLFFSAPVSVRVLSGN